MTLNNLKKQVEDLKRKNPGVIDDTMSIWERIDQAERILESPEYQEYKKHLKCGDDLAASKVLDTRPPLEWEHFQRLYCFELWVESIS